MRTTVHALLCSCLLASAAHQAIADDVPNCPTSLSGFELHPLPKYSSIGKTGLICNYTMTSSDKEHSAGMAISIEYDCTAKTEENFKSKTRARDKYNPSAEQYRGEVSRSGTSLLLREDRHGEGYAGPFTVQEKMFLMVDQQTIATIVVNTDVKPPPPGTEDKPDPNVLVFSADQAPGLAQSLAASYASLKGNLECRGGGGSVQEENPPKIEMSLKVKLELTTDSPRKRISYGETASFPVKVTAIGKETKGPVEAKHFAPLDVEFRCDDTLVERSTTDSEGAITFRYSPPEDTAPDKCKKHNFKAVASKEGVGSAEDTIEVEIQRGQCEHVIVQVTREGTEIPPEDGAILFTPPRDAPIRFRVQAHLDPERTPKRFVFQLGGPLASYGKVEQAEPTETAGEYEVRDVKLADVVLVVSPMSEDAAGTAGGIGLEIKADPD